MKNIHVLPTDKPSRLQKFEGVYGRELELCSKDEFFNKGVNIYITSDEKLPYDSSIFNSGAFYHVDAGGKVFIITKNTFKPNPNFCKRIILSTDQELIEDGVEAIDDEFLKWFVAHPSCEEVEVKLIKDSEDHPEIEGGYREEWEYYDIIIPKESPKQHLINMIEQDEELAMYEESFKHKVRVIPREEILDDRCSAYEFINFNKEVLEEAKKYDGENAASGVKSFIAGAKWQQERSEEEIIWALLLCSNKKFKNSLEVKEWWNNFNSI